MGSSEITVDDFVDSIASALFRIALTMQDKGVTVDPGKYTSQANRDICYLLLDAAINNTEPCCITSEFVRQGVLSIPPDVEIEEEVLAKVKHLITNPVTMDLVNRCMPILSVPEANRYRLILTMAGIMVLAEK